MPRRVAALLALAAAACGSSGEQQPLYPAGSDRDDGHGLLARASAKLLTGEAEPGLFSARRDRRDDGLGGDSYGGMTYGGAYGGAGYANYFPPPWSYPTVNRTPTYNQQPGLHAAIEGTITWRGAPPEVATACGTIEPLRIGPRRGVGGILVYIERVSVGRLMPDASGDQRPSTVGGVVVKRGCAFAPVVQIATPIPAALAIHGDPRRTRVRITDPAGVIRTAELHEAGRVALQLRPGVTRIESEDGSVGAAWVVGLDTPYYALTDDAGRFRLDELAPGSYQVSIWQPPLPQLTNGRLVYGSPVIVTRTIQVDTRRAARLDVTLGR